MRFRDLRKVLALEWTTHVVGSDSSEPYSTDHSWPILWASRALKKETAIVCPVKRIVASEFDSAPEVFLQVADAFPIDARVKSRGFSVYPFIFRPGDGIVFTFSI